VSSAGYFAGLQAGGAHVDLLGRAIGHGANRLNIGVPAAGGATVGVGDRVPKTRLLAANIAVGSHSALLDQGDLRPLVSRNVSGQVFDRT